jgi:hypothetical protein
MLLWFTSAKPKRGSAEIATGKRGSVPALARRTAERMDVDGFKASIYALLRDANEVELELSDAEQASVEYERLLSIPKAERLRLRIANALHEVEALQSESGFEELEQSSPELVARMRKLSEIFATAGERTARLTP